jgi:hypothetical protein
MRYCPYLWSASPFSLYLSVGLTMAALSWEAIGSRGACWSPCQHLRQTLQYRRLHTRRFAASGLSAATSFARRAVAAKDRTAGRAQLTERTAWPNGRPTAWRRAIVYVFRMVRLRAAVRRRVRMSSSMFVASCTGSPLLFLDLGQPRDACRARLPDLLCRRSRPHHHHLHHFLTCSYSRSAFSFGRGCPFLHLGLLPRATFSPSRRLSLDATVTDCQRTPNLTSCLAYNRTSSSTMTRRNAAPSASRSSTCPTGTSDHALVATRCAPLENSARPLTPSSANAPRQICQFCYNNIKTNMNGLCPACRRVYDDSTIEFKTITPEECVFSASCTLAAD